MKLTNLVKSPYDSRDHKFVATISELPPAVDLMPEVEEIENQRDAGSCTAHATTTGVEVIDNRGGYREKLSPQFNYDVTRAYENRINQSGAVLRDAIKMGMHFGFCLESEYPYLNSEQNGTPPPECYVSAATRKITKYEAVQLPTLGSGLSYWDGVANLKKALAEGLPVVIAMRVFQPIFGMKGPLKDQVYRPYGTPEAGNHAVTIIGYNDEWSGFIYANSWGKEWGDGGFGLLPYQAFGEIFEAWVIRGYRDITINPPIKGAVMPTTIKLPQGTANERGEIVFAHNMPGLQNKILRADAVYQDANWPEVRRPMRFIYCDQTHLRFENPDAARRACFASFEYAD